MKIEIKNLADWAFDLDEVSMGVYKLKGKHVSGANIEFTGTSCDNLKQKAQEAAVEIQQQIAQKIKEPNTSGT
jgi:5-formaminoimidazole-4-carboxamide-1-beta-D-ribofuranosyl 5'-monophosphate synthetase